MNRVIVIALAAALGACAAWPTPPGVLWHHYEPFKAYGSTDFGNGGEFIFAGSDGTVQLFPTAGSGKFNWEVFRGYHLGVYTAAAKKAAVCCAGYPWAQEIWFFKAKSSRPVWTYHSWDWDALAAVEIPANGAFVAAGTVYRAGHSWAHFIDIHDSENGSKVASANHDPTESPGALAVTPDGRFLMEGTRELFVYKFDFKEAKLVLRKQLDTGDTNCRALSPDGRYVAHGRDEMTVWRWTGSTYEVVFVYGEPGYENNCVLFDGAGHLYSAWRDVDSRQPRIVCHTIPSSTPTWKYDYKKAGGAYDERVNSLAVSDDGKFLVAASAGSADNANPEIELLNGLTGKFLFGVDTPGSMYCCDMTGDGLYAAAAGKHVHDDEYGPGGDIYAIKVYTGIPVDGPDSFVARRVERGVEVSWRGRWHSLAGFNLLRECASAAADEKRVKLNDELITGRSPYRFVDDGVAAGGAYRYWLEAVDLSGGKETFGPAEVELRSKPGAFALYQNFPNPARGATTVAFCVPAPCEASLEVYDVTGRKVASHSLRAEAGANEVDVDVSSLAPGVYAYRVEGGGNAAARKLVVAR